MKNYKVSTKQTLIIGLTAILSACGEPKNNANNHLGPNNAGINDSMASCLPNIAGVQVIARGTGYIGNNRETLELIVFKNPDGSINASGRMRVSSIDTFLGRGGWYGSAPASGVGFDGCLQASAAVQFQPYSPYANVAATLSGPGVTVSIGARYPGSAYFAEDQLRGDVVVQFSGRESAETYAQPY